MNTAQRQRVRDLFEQAVDRDPANRFVSASEVVSALAADVGPAVVASDDVAEWWRTHQVTAIALSLVACIVAWQIKEWTNGLARELFLFIGAVATIVGVFRGHLLFTERMNRASFAVERRRAQPVTLVADLAIATVPARDGLTIRDGRPVVALLTIALAIAIALTRLVVEQSTTRGAFGDPNV